MTTTYLDLILRGARAYPDRIAVKVGDEAFTFSQVDTLSSQLAQALMACGARPGARIALLVNNGIHSVPVDFACVKAGINRVPLNSRLSLAEHARMLADVQVSHLVFGSDLVERAAELAGAVPGLICHGLGARITGGSDLLQDAANYSGESPRVQAPDDEIVLTLFTSGTTGTLKAAQHSQASYAGICKNVLLNLGDIQHQDSMLHAASLIHASGVFVLPYWLRGARTVIMPGFDPGLFLKLIADERITAVNMVPTMLQMLLGHPGFASTDVSSLRKVIYGASPMPRPVIQQAMAIWGRERFWQYYGQTECPLTIAVLRPEDHEDELLGACGRPSIDVEIRLVNETGEDVPAGEPGEIAVRGPSLMTGYYNADALNQEMWMDGGWLRTRDIGMFDERGYLHLKDRTSDMIITGGYNVYPREIEEVLISHSAVAECAAVGLKDEKWVEAVTVAVALKSGQQASEQELIDFVAERVASYKKPRRIVFVDAVPKTAVGKLNRRALREMLNS